MTEDPFEPEPPFVYECFDCGRRIDVAEREDLEDDAELAACPSCGGDVRTVTTASGE